MHLKNPVVKYQKAWPGYCRWSWSLMYKLFSSTELHTPVVSLRGRYKHPGNICAVTWLVHGVQKGGSGSWFLVSRIVVFGRTAPLNVLVPCIVICYTSPFCKRLKLFSVILSTFLWTHFKWRGHFCIFKSMFMSVLYVSIQTLCIPAHIE